MPNRQAELLNDRGLISFNNGEYDKALNDFNEALKLDKDYPACYVNRGNALLKKGDFQKALDDFNAAINLNPNDPKALAGRANAYLNLKEYDKGIENINKAIIIEPFNTDLKNILGELFIKKGEAELSSKPIISAPKKSMYLRYKDKLSEFTFEGEVKETINDRLEELERLENSFDTSNAISIQNWFEWIVKLPWKDTPPLENYTLSEARKVLEEDHYGLYDVKDRIIEFLAVRRKKKDSRGAILCLSGEPGVGKTSVGKSIDRATNKEFFRFSVGGVHDETEIRGHRRAYIGSQPGQIIKGLATKRTKSLVCLIDEVDKMNSSLQGDPYAALLEVLDPEQNNTFRDHYIDLPFDLSNVFFILTANDYKKIPDALQNRMEIISIPGYVEKEKFEIARKHLIPKTLLNNGLEKAQVSYTNDAISHIISYENEPGVWLLEQNLNKIHRKLVRRIIEKQEAGEAEAEADKTFVFEKQHVEEYLGERKQIEVIQQKADRPGMAVGLSVRGGAWGVPLLIETISVPGEEGYTITGNIVMDKETSTSLMKESVEIAFSYAQKYAIEHNFCDRSWFKENHVHIHFPEPTLKEGNSAGITITTALLSLIKNQVVTDKIVMTGEITLTGRVLAIGGLKEKIIGAKNNNAEHVIFPKQNMREFEEIPDLVKEGVEFHPVERFEEVLALMLPD
jgi:ATP-dependent Lon protease